MRQGQRLWDELHQLGYTFTWKRGILTYGGVIGLSLLLGVFFRLSGGYVAVLCVFCILMLPFFIRNLYRQKYEQQRFAEVNIYMEQFLYSFQKSGKILTTLEDVASLFSQGQMYSLLQQAISFIRHTYGEDQVSEKALDLIGEEYGVPQMTTIHRFALQVEKNGGAYSDAILLLLDARRLWEDRVAEFWKEKRRRRVQVMMSVLVSLLLCSVFFFVADRVSLDISGYTVTQVTTLCTLLLDLVIFYVADCRLAVGFAEEIYDDEALLRQYKKVRACARTGRKSLGVSIARKKVSRAMRIRFPQWLMEVSLLLQSENVQVAIMRSYEDAPLLLKPELKLLIERLKKQPTELEPYLLFLQDYPLPEVQSSMKMLYSISEGTGGNAGNQIADIIRRNERLLDQAQKMKNEDALAGMYALFLAPQLTGGAKLLADMMMFFYALAANALVL